VRGRGPRVSRYKGNIAIPFLSSAVYSSLIKEHVLSRPFGRASAKKNYRPWEDGEKG